VSRPGARERCCTGRGTAARSTSSITRFLHLSRWRAVGVVTVACGRAPLRPSPIRPWAGLAGDEGGILRTACDSSVVAFRGTAGASRLDDPSGDGDGRTVLLAADGPHRPWPALLARVGRRPCAHGRAVSQSARHEPTGLGWHAVGVPIDVALLGCGHPHVPDVLGVLASERDLRLVAAWDPDPSAIPFAVSGAAVARVESAIGRAHAVVICAPTDQRPALCVQAARAGRPILVEQPVARSAAEARAVAHQIGRSRTPALAALFLRELPALGRLGGVLRERLLGRVASASASLAHPGAIDGWFAGPCAWIRDPRRAGVGGFGDLALHLSMRWRR
jgi:hypothetical protein